MKTTPPRVSLAFSAGTDGRLVTTAQSVLLHLYKLPDFRSAPVSAATLEEATLGLVRARRACTRHELHAESRRKHRRIAVVRLLQTLAFYVQGHCHGDAGLLRATGFKLDRAAGRPAPSRATRRVRA